MPEKYRNGHRDNNTDDQNTKTTYIPPEVKEQYSRRDYPSQRHRDRSPQQQYQQNPQQGYYGGNQQQYQSPQQDYYSGNQQQYQNPQQDYYNRQQPQYRNPQQPGYYNNDPHYQEQLNEYYSQQPQYYSQQQQQPNFYSEQRQSHSHPIEYYGGQPRRKKQEFKQQPKHKRRPATQPASQKTPPHKTKRRKKASSVGTFIKRFLIFLIIFLILLFGLYSLVALSLIKKMNYQPTGDRQRTDGALAKSSVTSILLIGSDGRSLDERGRSDTMMLISLNSASNRMTVTSFMRDCYVEIPGYGWDKLNASYSYGGPELLMDTIEHNFGIKVDDYISINFISFASIVDSVGGIDVDLSDEEAQEINTILQAEVNEIMGDDPLDSLLPSGGSQIHLNGKQALSYARIRYVGNADFERTERQRRVVNLVMNKLKTCSPVMLKNISSDVMPEITTNSDTSKLYLLSLRAPTLLTYDREQLQIPIEGSYYGDSTPSGDALIVDLNTNHDTLREVIFSS